MCRAHVADELANSGQEIRLGGEQREVSVLFCDIRGFTAWSELAGAEEVIAQLNVLLRELSAAVMEAGGTLDKYTGDGLMAFWNAPLDQDDHASLACTAALDMLVRLQSSNDERILAGLAPFEIGVGVHSGLAVVGNIGHEDRLDYTAIGDTVNTSARLEAATKEVGSPVLLSAATRDLLPPRLRDLCADRGSVSVKGKQLPIEVATPVSGTPYESLRAWQDASGCELPGEPAAA